MRKATLRLLLVSDGRVTQEQDSRLLARKTCGLHSSDSLIGVKETCCSIYTRLSILMMDLAIK